MSAEDMWNIFAESGRVEDYLAYSAAKDNTQDDNTRRDSPERTLSGRTGQIC